MLHVALWEPEIPPNTGNIARLCAATGCTLHLVGRLGFRTDDRSLKRAGCDYWPLVTVRYHADLGAFEAEMADSRVFCVECERGVPYSRVQYRPGDCLLFGSESRGLPDEVLERRAGSVVHVPMPAAGVRSINLAGAVSVVVYEGLRQLHNW